MADAGAKTLLVVALIGAVGTITAAIIAHSSNAPVDRLDPAKISPVTLNPNKPAILETETLRISTELGEDEQWETEEIIIDGVDHGSLSINKNHSSNDLSFIVAKNSQYQYEIRWTALWLRDGETALERAGDDKGVIAGSSAGKYKIAYHHNSFTTDSKTLIYLDPQD